MRSVLFPMAALLALGGCAAKPPEAVPSPPPHPSSHLRNFIMCLISHAVPYEPLTRADAVAIAMREWLAFGQPVDDDPPDTRPPLPADLMPERMPGLWERVGSYLVAGPGRRPARGRVDRQARRRRNRIQRRPGRLLRMVRGVHILRDAHGRRRGRLSVCAVALCLHQRRRATGAGPREGLGDHRAASKRIPAGTRGHHLHRPRPGQAYGFRQAAGTAVSGTLRHRGRHHAGGPAERGWGQCGPRGDDEAHPGHTGRPPRGTERHGFGHPL